jgi:hypothetical protein
MPKGWGEEHMQMAGEEAHPPDRKRGATTEGLGFWFHQPSRPMGLSASNGGGSSRLGGLEAEKLSYPTDRLGVVRGSPLLRSFKG